MPAGGTRTVREGPRRVEDAGTPVALRSSMVSVNDVARALSIQPGALSEADSALIRRYMAGASPNVDQVLVADANVDPGYVDTSIGTLEAVGRAMAAQALSQTVDQMSKTVGLQDLAQAISDPSKAKSLANEAIGVFNEQTAQIGQQAMNHAKSELMGKDKPNVAEAQQVAQSLQAVTEAVQDQATQIGKEVDQAISDIESKSDTTSANTGTCTGTCASAADASATDASANGSDSGSTGGSGAGNGGGTGAAGGEGNDGQGAGK